MAAGGTTRPSKVYNIGIARQVSIDSRNTPPYWQLHRTSTSSTSSVTAVVIHRAPIALEDHTEQCSESCGPLWVKQVTIDEYAVVAGNAIGNGGHVVWKCTVDMLEVSNTLLSCRRWRMIAS